MGTASVPCSRGTAPIVESIFSRIWANMLPCITLSSHSYGDVRLHGARCGRGQLRLCRSYAMDSRCTSGGEGGKSGPLFSAVDSY